MRPITTARFVLAVLATLAAGFIAACGNDDESGPGSGGSGIDRAFVAEMIPHHESAVEMADLAKERAQHEKIKRLADEIIETQNAEIETMRTLAERMDAEGVEKGDLGMADHEMGMGGDMEELETANPFDRAFIDAMIVHHQGAIRMAHVQLANGKDPEVKQLAEAIVDAQTKEIDEMNMWRVDWYGEISPAGGVPSEDGHMEGGDMEDIGH